MEKDPDGVLDLSVLGEMCSKPGRLDDPVLIRLIALFVREEGPLMTELGRLAEKRNAAELARIAHKLAGSCAVIGATQMFEAAQALERKARTGAWAEVPAQVGAVRAAWSLLQVVLARHKLVLK
jgi:HPt (histidine-containing phosphotransfer) domain-containing protein